MTIDFLNYKKNFDNDGYFICRNVFNKDFILQLINEINKSKNSMTKCRPTAPKAAEFYLKFRKEVKKMCPILFQRQKISTNRQKYQNHNLNSKSQVC